MYCIPLLQVDLHNSIFPYALSIKYISLPQSFIPDVKYSMILPTTKKYSCIYRAHMQKWRNLSANCLGCQQTA